MACKDEEHYPINDDPFPIYIKMKEAEAIILVAPVYFSLATALLKAIMESASYIARHNSRLFTGKVGGPLVVAHRAGQNFTLDQLIYWFHLQEFFMPGSTYCNIAFGKNKGEVENDEKGFATAWLFGNNIALLMNKLNA